MQLYLIRHGQSQFNLLGEEAGTDSELSELGWEQAERLGAWLRPRGPFDAFYSSTYLRARQTAEAVSRQVEAPPVVPLETLREADFHILEVLPQFSQPSDVLRDGRRPPASDAYDHFRAQVQSALRTIVQTGADQGHKKILVVCHAGTQGTIIRLLVGSEYISIWSQNCCVHLVAWTDNRWEIRFLNRTDYLSDLISGRQMP